MPILSLMHEPSPKTRLKKALDVIVSKQVRERDGYTCRKCGHNRGAYGKFDSKGRVFHHHIFTKSRLTTRWILENGVTLCFFCHRWAHSAGEEFRQWVLTWMSQAEYDALYIKSQMRGGFKICDLELLLWDMRRAA